MKKLLFFFITFTLLSSTFAQNYSLVKDSAVWRVMSSDISSWFTYYSYDQAFLNGDTTINNTVYKKLYRTNYGTLFNPKIYMGGIREDSNSSFFLPDSNYVMGCTHGLIINQEYLLYDFAMEQGDTFYRPHYFHIWNQDSLFSVGYKDSVFINHQWRTRLEIYSQSFSDFWIEGIGSTYGILGSLGQYFECDAQLNCYEDNETYYSPSYLSTYDCLSVGIKESIKKKQTRISISPNPTQTEFKLIYNGKENYTDGNLWLYTTRGELVFSETVILNNNQAQVDCSNIKSGFYIVKFIANNTPFYHKIIIQ